MGLKTLVALRAIGVFCNLTSEKEKAKMCWSCNLDCVIHQCERKRKEVYMSMITVCNNKMCKNRDTPCVAGYIHQGEAELWSINQNYSPWFPGVVIVPIPICYCKQGGYSETKSK